MKFIKVRRITKETQIEGMLNISGKGNYKIDCKIGFFKHLLESFARHGLFDLNMKISGDTEVDQHHTIEDAGIVLGQLFSKAIKDKSGIQRAGFFIFPMDEALTLVAIDLSNRPYLGYDLRFKNRFIGELESDLIEDFFGGFVNELRCALHIQSIKGRSDHHKAESVFKAFGRALKMAVSQYKKGVLLSTKGVL